MKPRYVKGSNREWGRFNSFIGKVVRCIMIAGAVTTAVVVIIAAKKFYPIVSVWYRDSIAIAESSTTKDFRASETSYIYAANGVQLLKLRQGKDVEYVEYADLPESVLSAFVAIEDKRFWQHNGVDWFSTAKATILLIKNDGKIVRGGSTITQQLARNMYLSFETSYERKVREIFLAHALETKYTKEQILEFYVNNINYSNGYYGIGTAAKGYFGKSVSELSVEEVAFLCAIPNNPTYYDPKDKFDNTVSRRNIILQEMCHQGYLTEDEYLRACNSPVKLVEVESVYCDYAASYALECAIRMFMGKSGFEFQYAWDDSDSYDSYRASYKEAYEEAKNLLYTGGYRVYTSLDLSAQDNLQAVLDEQLSAFQETTESGDFVVQGAATVVDNESGLVIASIGGRVTEDVSYLKLNRAYQSYKQPGSTIKPLIVYAPAFENGYTPDTVVCDEPIVDGPKNSDGGYWGSLTLRSAVEQSRNTVAWKLFQELTPRVGLGYVQDMQFNRIVPDDYYLPASLGG